jgi:hypothetical protein
MTWCVGEGARNLGTKCTSKEVAVGKLFLALSKFLSLQGVLLGHHLDPCSALKNKMWCGSFDW